MTEISCIYFYFTHLGNGLIGLVWYNNLRQINRISGLSRAKARLAGTRLSENILSSNPFVNFKLNMVYLIMTENYYVSLIEL